MEEIISFGKKKFLSEFDIQEIEWESTSMKNIMNTIPKIASSKSRVLIRGETGTGKTMIAKMIHNLSEFKNLPFLIFDSLAINESELDNNMISDKKQKLNSSKNFENIGTLFFRDIEILNFDSQYKIFSLIKKWEYEGKKFRVISSIKSDFWDKINNRNFMEEFYYYLNVIHLHIPPLRERPEDIQPLVNHLSEIICKKIERGIVYFESGEIIKLQNLKLKGNILEIANLVERTIVLSPEDVQRLTFSDFYFRDFNDEENLNRKYDFSTHKKNFLKKTIEEAIKQSSGVKKDAAKNLGMSRRALSYYISKYDIS